MRPSLRSQIMTCASFPALAINLLHLLMSMSVIKSKWPCKLACNLKVFLSQILIILQKKLSDAVKTSSISSVSARLLGG